MDSGYGIKSEIFMLWEKINMGVTFLGILKAINQAQNSSHKLPETMINYDKTSRRFWNPLGYGPGFKPGLTHGFTQSIFYDWWG